jgi:hypothetical protein
MRRSIMLVPVVALFLLTPTGVQAATGDLVVCDAPPEGTTVLKPGTGPTFEIASPELPDDQTEQLFMVDLSPATATNKATVNVTLNWQIAVNDFDMYLVDENGEELGASEGFQALGDPPTETVGATFLHCSSFTIQVYNFLAAGGSTVDAVDPLQLTAATGNTK